jgi:serine/threonine protein kinase
MAAIDLDKDQWQQLKGVLTDALKLPTAERLDMLNRRLANDPTLRQRAIEMLRYYDRATKPFGVTETQLETRGDHAEKTPQPQLAPGAVIGNYRIVRKLGEGGMGVVYLAEDERLGRHVALKFLFPSVRGKLMDSKGHLLAESRSAAVLNHPGIVTFHDVFESRDELVAVMEYVEGRPLAELIAGDPLPLGFALRLAGQLADALAYAHGRGIIHCDLKPANIHVLPNGATKILDFGIARAVARPDDDTEPLDRPVFGTPGYLSPERLLGREATAPSDVDALGVVM